jgi:hypothetical protein
MAKEIYKRTYQDLKVFMRLQTMIIVALIGVCLYTITISNRDPLVIRETLTDIQVVDVESSQLNEFDVEIFLRHFTQHLNLFDSYAINNAHLALNMMEPELRTRFIRDVLDPKVVEQIKSTKTTTATSYNEISFEQQGDQIKCVVIYTRKRESFVQDKLADKVIRLDMILSITSRTAEHPYGLLVQEYKRAGLS